MEKSAIRNMLMPTDLYLLGRDQKQSHSWFEELECSKANSLAVARGCYADSLPIRLKLVRRKKLLPVAWTGHYAVVSESIVGLLTARKISGWHAYPVLVEKSAGMEPRYAIGITGRCKKLTFERDPANFFTRIEYGRLGLYARLQIDLTRWDGSDLFMGANEDTVLKCATDAVVRAFESVKEPGITFERASDASMWVGRAPEV